MKEKQVTKSMCSVMPVLLTKNSRKIYIHIYINIHETICEDYMG